MKQEIFEIQLKQIRKSLKSAVKSKRMTYRQLAAATGFSLLKVRRLMSVQEFKIIELLKIAAAVDFQLLSSDFLSQESMGSNSSNGLNSRNNTYAGVGHVLPLREKSTESASG